MEGHHNMWVSLATTLISPKWTIFQKKIKFKNKWIWAGKELFLVTLLSHQDTPQEAMMSVSLCKPQTEAPKHMKLCGMHHLFKERWKNILFKCMFWRWIKSSLQCSDLLTLCSILCIQMVWRVFYGSFPSFRRDV